MNVTAVIATLIALLGGFAVGSTLSINDTRDITKISNQAQERFISENPKAEDFVSLRPSISTLPSEALSIEEREGLLLMREEEKLARDVYQTLYEQWKLKIFSNIAQSEQTHTEAVRDLLIKYNIDDPVTDDTIGVFTNPTFKKLYDTLVTQGNESEVAAIIVGATIEDLDIRDLQELIAQTNNQDITLVYENLTRGSRNHLRAFTKQLTERGETYAPQYLSTTAYQEIINNDQEMGSGNQTNGYGKNGRGWGERGGL